MRYSFLVGLTAMNLILIVTSLSVPNLLWSYMLLGPLMAVAIYDTFQKKHSIRRNFPVLGHFRYIFEAIRPEINQYFVESDTDGVPFSRVERSIVYQRAKKQTETLPFGTKIDVNSIGYCWVNHSLAPRDVDPKDLRVKIGGSHCTLPYQSSLLNISAMSYGSLSKNAILALNQGAKMGGFAHDTGEGGISPYHLRGEGDLIWEVGTGYFGCRTRDGKFDKSQFKDKSKINQVKMIEIKLSQGAKPGHGGILPAKKLTHEIAEIRGVPFGKDVVSPAAHSAFSNPIELVEFAHSLRELSGGKPVGIKLCIGKRREFLSICKAMKKLKVSFDFVVVDGGEGGTGAAPLEFSNHVGTPLKEALLFVHNCLVGFNLRSEVKIIAAGKVITAFDIIEKMALGADICNSARAMMMALGCIQALRCNTNKCPTGVATQDPHLVRGLDVQDKSKRVFQYHLNTLKSVADMMGAMGITRSSEIMPWHILTRINRNEVKHYGELFNYLKPGELLSGELPKEFKRAMEAARVDTWQSQEEKKLVAV